LVTIIAGKYSARPPERRPLQARRTIFTDAERRQLTEKARVLGRRALRELGTIIMLETLFRWHRQVFKPSL